MSLFTEQETIDTAWVDAVGEVSARPEGTATHLFVTVAHPERSTDPDVTNLVDATLQGRGRHPVTTVANTLFPSALYHAPAFDWSPELQATEVDELDHAAHDLYSTYLDMLPELVRFGGNSHGTYFSRMISWTGRTSNGVNQLDRRIAFLRGERRNGRSTSNTSDIAIIGEADGANDLEDLLGATLEEYAVSDTRTQGFPCLVHIDISVRAGALSLLGVYRHWHLITRGYGNLVGLARLQEFLCQQTGFAPGELAVAAGHANAETDTYGKRTVAELTQRTREALAATRGA